jgi:hypothetical protein
MIFGSASFRDRPEELDACLDEIHTFVGRVRQGPGTRSYVSLRSSLDPTEEFTSSLYPRCVEPATFDEYVEVDRAGSAHRRTSEAEPTRLGVA